MSLTIKANYKNGKIKTEKNIDKIWFTIEEKQFLKNNDVLIESYEQYSSDDFDDYRDYMNRQDEEYQWRYSVYVNGEYKTGYEANSYDYITSYIQEQVM